MAFLSIQSCMKTPIPHIAKLLSSESFKGTVISFGDSRITIVKWGDDFLVGFTLSESALQKEAGILNICVANRGRIVQKTPTVRIGTQIVRATYISFAEHSQIVLSLESLRKKNPDIFPWLVREASPSWIWARVA
jgi:hypothetical protein